MTGDSRFRGMISGLAGAAIVEISAFLRARGGRGGASSTPSSAGGWEWRAGVRTRRGVRSRLARWRRDAERGGWGQPPTSQPPTSQPPPSQPARHLRRRSIRTQCPRARAWRPRVRARRLRGHTRWTRANARRSRAHTRRTRAHARQPRGHARRTRARARRSRAWTKRDFVRAHARLVRAQADVVRAQVGLGRASGRDRRGSAALAGLSRAELPDVVDSVRIRDQIVKRRPRRFDVRGVARGRVSAGLRGRWAFARGRALWVGVRTRRPAPSREGIGPSEGNAWHAASLPS